MPAITFCCVEAALLGVGGVDAESFCGSEGPVSTVPVGGVPSESEDF